MLRSLLFAFLLLQVLAEDASLPLEPISSSGAPGFAAPDFVQQPYPLLGDTFDSPSHTLAEPVPVIPHFPECTVRPQTMVEVQRMRESARRISQMITQEVEVMNRRKTYIEQMTSYLNDRIRELNKVKLELKEEIRWIEVSTHRIAELGEREKLIKLQDVLSCLDEHQTQVAGRASVGEAALSKLQTQQEELQKSLDSIRQKIDSANTGGDNG